MKILPVIFRLVPSYVSMFCHGLFEMGSSKLAAFCVSSFDISS